MGLKEFDPSLTLPNGGLLLPLSCHYFLLAYYNGMSTLHSVLYGTVTHTCGNRNEVQMALINHDILVEMTLVV